MFRQSLHFGNQFVRREIGEVSDSEPVVKTLQLLASEHFESLVTLQSSADDEYLFRTRMESQCQIQGFPVSVIVHNPGHAWPGLELRVAWTLDRGGENNRGVREEVIAVFQ